MGIWLKSSYFGHRVFVEQGGECNGETHRAGQSAGVGKSSIAQHLARRCIFVLLMYSKTRSNYAARFGAIFKQRL
jgi:hypothetical protein